MTDQSMCYEFEAWALRELKQDAAKWRHPDGDYVYLEREWKAWQAATRQALERFQLPTSYGGSTFETWGDQKQGCTIRIHLTDADQADAWFERLTSHYDAIRALEG